VECASQWILFLCHSLKDDDCEAGLECFSRDANEAVPGCVGFGADTFDYCYERSDTDLVLIDDFFESFVLDTCQGGRFYLVAVARRISLCRVSVILTSYSLRRL
jgi:hypothetical protein